MIAAGILAASSAWFGLATWHFGVYPARTLARCTRERPVQPIAVELFRFLAGLNLALAALAAGAIACGPEARRLAFAALCLGNASQLLQDLRVERLGLAGGAMFRTILVGDLVFAVLDAVGTALV